MSNYPRLMRSGAHHDAIQFLKGSKRLAEHGFTYYLRVLSDHRVSSPVRIRRSKIALPFYVPLRIAAVVLDELGI